MKIKFLLFFLFANVYAYSQINQNSIRVGYVNNLINQNPNLNHYFSKSDVLEISYSFAFGDKLSAKLGVDYFSYKVNPNYEIETQNLTSTDFFLLSIGYSIPPLYPIPKFFQINLNLGLEYSLLYYKGFSVPISASISLNREAKSYSYYAHDELNNIPKTENISEIKQLFALDASIALQYTFRKRIALSISSRYFKLMNLTFGLREAKLQYPAIRYSLIWYFLKNK